jgi:hypothetical protein
LNEHQGNLHIQLSQCDFDAQIVERLHVGGLLLIGWGLSGDEMALQPNTVDSDASLLEVLDHGSHGVALVANGLNVVIVVVQLGLFVVLVGDLENGGHVIWAKGVQPQVLAEGAILVKALIDDVPGVAFALEVGHLMSDVVLQDREELWLGPVLACEPVWQLAVPNKIVATAKLT